MVWGFTTYWEQNLNSKRRVIELKDKGFKGKVRLRSFSVIDWGRTKLGEPGNKTEQSSKEIRSKGVIHAGEQKNVET